MTDKIKMRKNLIF